VVIERGEDLFTELDRDFEIHPGDSIYLCGSEEAVEKYFELFPQARSVPTRAHH
jgi:uncharacterized protein with PhoU and TrkA domain